MKHLFVSLFLLCQFTASARVDYRQYHREVTRCEALFLFQNDTAGAVRSYARLFAEYRPFAKDCFIALQLAALLGDKVSADNLFPVAFRAGLTWEAVMQSEVITRLLNADAVLLEKAKNSYSTNYKAFEADINKEYRQQVIRWKTSDDSMKMRMQGFPPGDATGKARFIEYQQLLEKNVLEMKEMIRKHGFPSERQVGYMDYALDGGEEQRMEYCYSLRLLPDQLFFHHGCAFFLSMEELDSALISGDILPAAYAAIYEWAYKAQREGRLPASLCVPRAPQSWYFNICPVIPPWERQKDVDVVNNSRYNIGLSSLEHESRKKEVEKKTGLKLFFGMFGLY